MYKVTTIITPVQYATRLQSATNRYNAASSTDITNLDISTLQALHEARTTIRKTPLMRAVRGRLNAVTFDASLSRLLDLKYVSRMEHNKRAVYYSITIAGRQVLAEINALLIDLVQQSIAANK